MARVLSTFELPDLLVALCDAGELSLAARIARAFYPPRGATPPCDQPEGGGEDRGVAGDEEEAAATIEPLEGELEAARGRR